VTTGDRDPVTTGDRDPVTNGGRPPVIRLAAFGDVHVGVDSAGTVAPSFEGLADRVDALLVAGDLTRCGTVDEAQVFARELAGVGVPVVAVLGNHDHHDDRPADVTAVLEAAGVRVLDGETTVIDVGGARLGVAGVKGFGGGFAGGVLHAFGEREMKAFADTARDEASRLEAALESLDTDVRVALLHYAPVAGTVAGERHEIYPFLGSQLLAQAVDRAGAHLVLHGHAHAGSEHGTTPGGVPVRNVAQPVIGSPYRVLTLPADGSVPLHRAAAVPSVAGR
jgi:Icc-related predicted phosphoesterase